MRDAKSCNSIKKGGATRQEVIKMAVKERLSDDKFPLLMDRKTVAEYLGFSVATVDKAVEHGGLDEAVTSPSYLNRTYYIKPKVNKWVEGL